MARALLERRAFVKSPALSHTSRTSDARTLLAADIGMTFDVVIVGGGPAGLSAALLLGRCRRKVALFDDLDPRNARSTNVHGFLTREGVDPWDLRGIARAQLAPFDVELRDVRVQDARIVEGGFELEVEGGERVQCKKLVLATGMRDVDPELEGAAPLLGRSLHSCPYCHGWEARDRKLAAYAWCDDAVDFALGLTTWSHDVVLFTEGKRAVDERERALLERNGVGLCEATIARLESDREGELARIVLADRTVLSRDALFYHLGRSQRSPLPAKLGVVFEENATVATGTCERTNVPGLWVVGDASHDVQFAIVAAAEGAKAGYAINRELRAECCR